MVSFNSIISNRLQHQYSTSEWILTLNAWEDFGILEHCPTFPAGRLHQALKLPSCLHIYLTYIKLHSKLRNINKPNVTPSLISRVLSLNLTRCHVSFPYIMGFDITINHQRIQTTSSHALLVIVVIIAMLTLCYSIISHTTLILFYQTSMLALQNSLISRALWLSPARYYIVQSVLSFGIEGC